MDDLIIGPDYDGSRVDRFLRKMFPAAPLSLLYKDLRRGRVRVNGKKARENLRLRTGDRVAVPYGPVEAPAPSAQRGGSFPFPLVYEDERMAVVDKPGGVVVHKGSGHEDGLIELFRSSFGLPDASPVHRLDKGTSGLLLIGKTRAAVRELTALIREGNVEKRYTALVKGLTPRGPLHLSDMIIRGETGSFISATGGREALGEMRLLRHGAGLSLVEITLVTGRTHQIRLQLASRGWPIVGDGRYGFKRKGPLFLCATYLALPSQGFQWTKEIPHAFTQLLDKGI
jgi:23S rRNA pseudouridine955/2504/2580 synthase